MALELSCISDLSIKLIKTIFKMLDISTKFLKFSDLDCYEKKVDLLAHIYLTVNATLYISTPGLAIYLEKSNSFEKICLPVRYFEYSKQIYNQICGDLIPNLSIIDMLFNCGEETKEFLNKKN